MFSLAISYLTASNLPWFMDLTSRFPCNIALYSIRLYCHYQSCLQLGAVFLWLCLFVLAGVISSLFSSNILGTYQPGELIFQHPIFLPFQLLRVDMDINQSFLEVYIQGQNSLKLCVNLWTYEKRGIKDRHTSGRNSWYLEQNKNAMKNDIFYCF